MLVRLRGSEGRALDQKKTWIRNWTELVDTVKFNRRSCSCARTCAKVHCLHPRPNSCSRHFTGMAGNALIKTRARLRKKCMFTTAALEET